MIGKVQQIEMIQQRLNGKTIKQVAESFNITSRQVINILQKPENIEIREKMIERIAMNQADAIM